MKDSSNITRDLSKNDAYLTEDNGGLTGSTVNSIVTNYAIANEFLQGTQVILANVYTITVDAYTVYLQGTKSDALLKALYLADFVTLSEDANFLVMRRSFRGLAFKATLVKEAE